MTITVRTLQSLLRRPGKTLSEKLGARGAGVLEFAASGPAVMASFRYSLRGVRSRVALGAWEEQSQERSLRALRRRAQGLAQRLQDGLPVHELPPAGSLRDLLADYSAGLRNPATQRYVVALFGRTVPERFLSQSAAGITTETVLTWLSQRVKAGATTEVNRARSYLRAAFQGPLDAAGDPRAAAGQSNVYGLLVNPVAGVRRIGEFERSKDRCLTDAELRALFAALPSLAPESARLLELTLRMGGQRAEQITQALRENGSIRLLDSKGARTQPRVHVLPVPRAARHLVDLVEDGERITAISAEQLRNTANRVGAWRYGDLRRTVETRMAELGIRKEVRDRIQSHGLSGVTERHYNRSDWLPQILIALDAWNTHLDAIVNDALAAPCENVQRLRA